MNKLLLGAACLCTSAMVHATPPPVVSSPTTIGFDDYSDRTFLGTFSDSGATFTPTGDTTTFEISTFGKSWGTIGPEILCPRTATINCGGDFDVTFGTPVSDLQFYFTGDDGTSPLSVGAYLNGILLGTINVDGDGVPNTAELVDLSRFSWVNEIRITGGAKDANGLGYDDFSFIALPEPSTWAMMLLGFGAIGVSVRRRRERSAPAAA